MPFLSGRLGAMRWGEAGPALKSHLKNSQLDFCAESTERRVNLSNTALTPAAHISVLRYDLAATAVNLKLIMKTCKVASV